MDRRTFLSATTLGALAGVTGVTAGCGGAQRRLAPSEAQALLDRLDRGLDAVREGTGPLSGPATANADRVAKLGLEALVVADVARSIPTEAPLPTSLAERLQQELPVLDRCTGTYASLLAGLPTPGRRQVDAEVRRRPDAAMDVAAWLGSGAATHGVSAQSRLELRQLATQVTRRARHQSMGAVIDDTVGKVERVIAHKGGSVSFARQATANAMLASIWQSIEQPGAPGGGGGTTSPRGGSRPSGDLGRPSSERVVLVEQQPPPERLPEEGRGDTELLVGGVLMGSGVAVFGIATLIGAAVGNAAMGALIGATPGGILVIVGLIVLLVGVAQNA